MDDVASNIRQALFAGPQLTTQLSAYKVVGDADMRQAWTMSQNSLLLLCTNVHRAPRHSHGEH